MVPFYGGGSAALRLQTHYEVAVYSTIYAAQTE